MDTIRKRETVPRGRPGGRLDDTTVVSWYGLTDYTHFVGDLAMAPISLVNRPRLELNGLGSSPQG